MKILLDENISGTLQINFEGHEIESVKSMNWVGTKNGELMKLIEINNFDLFVTHDRNIKHQQNLFKFDFKFVILVAKNNRDENVQPLVEKLKVLIQYPILEKVTEIK